MADKLAAEVARIVGETLGIPSGRIDGSVSALTCEAWDSLAQLRIMHALEEAFGLRFSLAELEQASSYDEILRLVEAKRRGR